MDRIFISELKIEHVRHLKDIRIPLSNDKMKHLILTGKNGSGKTSVLEALGRNLKEAVSNRQKLEERNILSYEHQLHILQKMEEKSCQAEELEKYIENLK